MSSKGIRRHAQNLLIILGSIGNIIFVVFLGGGGGGGRGYMVVLWLWHFDFEKSYRQEGRTENFIDCC